MKPRKNFKDKSHMTSKWGLKTKFVLGILLYLIIVTIVTDSFVLRHQHNLLVGEVTRGFKTKAEKINNEIKSFTEEISSFKFDAVLHEQLGGEPPVSLVAVSDSKGKIVASTNPLIVGCFSVGTFGQIGKEGNAKIENQEYFLSSFKSDERPFYTTTIGTLNQNVKAKIAFCQANLRKNLLVGFLISLIVGMAGGAVMASVVAWPLKRLVGCAEKLRDGDFSCQVPLGRGDELGVLARTFHTMSAAIHEREQQIISHNETLRERVASCLTEQAKLQRQVMVAEKLSSLGRLAAGVAHEINNPLCNILMYSKLLREDDPTNAKLKKIEEATVQCKDIVDQLLDLSRYRPLSASLQPVFPLVQEVIEDFQSHLKEAVRFELIDGDSSAEALIDRLQFRRVLVNVFQNAVDASPDGGTVFVSVILNDGEICVRVVDQGPGIKQENIDKVFEPFFTSKGDGVGLGLSISQTIVERLGGSITLLNNSGGGVTCTITLSAKKSTPCWVAMDCPEETRAECPVFLKKMEIQCWMKIGMACGSPMELDRCFKCQYYKQSHAVGGRDER